VLLVAAQGNPGPPPEWRTTQDLPVDRAGLVTVLLPLETLDAAEPGLEDLRFLDPSGRDLPWAPERPPPAASSARPPLGMRTFLREESTEIVLETGLREPLARVDLAIASADFVKGARVDESQDGRTWKTLRQDEAIFSVPGGARRTSIDLPALPRAFLRVTLDDRRSRPVAVTSAALLPGSPDPMPTAPIEVAVADRREEPGRTRLVLRFPGRHARLAEISLETPEPVFLRRFELSVARGDRLDLLAADTLYRTALEGRPASEWKSLLTDLRLPARELILSIDNGDSPPLRVDRLRARVRSVRVFFVAPAAGVYRVLAGNPAAARPRYDVGALGGGEVEGTTVVPGPLGVNPAWRPPDPLPGAATIGAPLDTGPWPFRKEIHLGPGNLHELELDPDILSTGDAAGSDVRLVRAGFQVPYLWEAPPRLRPLELSATTSGSPENSGRSRWTLSLPRNGLPVKQISCRVTQPLFQRDARLIEELRDEWGVPERVTLGRSSWSRLPGQAPDRLEMDLDRIPRGNRIILEVENGDNPPLDLEGFVALYAAPRIA
ncbi:MAG TPA: DUF3999 family protein, partial [Planctomycetota bacterium]|nr:DUF3999 family protein [Planctomycetota bacterium]